MKTLETINGQKVWAVDATGMCCDCMFLSRGNCMRYSQDAECVDEWRTDGRNVIFRPYEEDKPEKTFTLSQINEVVESLIAHPVKNETIAHWNLALRTLKSKLEQL